VCSTGSTGIAISSFITVFFLSIFEGLDFGL
jgi:hypothetical protein